MFTYPRWYLRFAIGAFHLFVATSALLATHPTEDHETSTRLARIGCANAALMWWVVDAMSRRHPIPFASLWICNVVLPGYLFTTRPTGHVIKRIVQHALLALLAAVVGGVAGAVFW